MRGYIANTDADWYRSLRDQSDVSSSIPREVNFWQPMGGRQFRAINVGAPIYFKLKKPHYKIAGFGIYAKHEVLPWQLAWAAFGQANGVASAPLMRQRLLQYRQKNRAAIDPSLPVGCIIVSDPIFFPEGQWVDQPNDWAPQIVSGKTYDLTRGEGQRIWRECQTRSSTDFNYSADGSSSSRDDQEEVFGTPRLVRPRIGQARFRISVTRAYEHACGVTREHSLPVIEAAHVRPVTQDGTHDTCNGIALRTDIHRLFDRGYATFDEDKRFVVSQRLKEEFENGRTYYRLEGQRLFSPTQQASRVDNAALEWHRNHVYVG